jgi:hypothetical protein
MKLVLFFVVVAVVLGRSLHGSKLSVLGVQNTCCSLDISCKECSIVDNKTAPLPDRKNRPV